MVKQKKWDEYEVALLIESVIKINNNTVPRNEELQSLSNLLRKRAKNLGLYVDEKFRNYNGMSLQVAAIESLLIPGRAERHYSQLFDQMTTLYKMDKVKFNSILAEAHEQVKCIINAGEQKNVI